MTKALLYQPNQKWRMGAALAAAALIHFAAIAIASLQHEQANDHPIMDGWSPPLDLTPEPSNDPTPPPDVVEPPPVLNPVADSLFRDERPTPPPIRQRIAQPAVPIVRPSSARVGPSRASSARINALTAPRPEYPYEARRQRITGNGIVAMTIDPVTGRVIDVVMEASTGSSVLDNAAMTGFRRWRFKPGTISRAKTPITFTMSGAQY